MTLLTSLLLQFLTLGPTVLFNSATLPPQQIIQHLPTEGTVTSGFGQRRHPIWGVRRHHSGVDIANRHNTLVYATAPGRVWRVGREGGYGLVLVIDHGNGWQSRYAHLDTAMPKRGDYVWSGAIVGRMGDSGHATGPHLHYELQFRGTSIDPMPHLAVLIRQNPLVLAKNDRF